MFTISKVIEMNSIEQNRVALYLFNSINYEIKNYKIISDTEFKDEEDNVYSFKTSLDK